MNMMNMKKNKILASLIGCLIFISTFAQASTLEIRTLSGERNIFEVGGSGAHGGNFDEMLVHNLGWEVLENLRGLNMESSLYDSFRDKLIDLQIVFVDSIELNGIQKGAANRPDDNVWYLTPDTYGRLINLEIPTRDRYQFFLHEFLPLMGLIDQGYVRSRDLVQKLSSHPIRPANAEVLYHQFYDGESGSYNGMTYSVAQQKCESVKNQYKNDYFTI